MDERKYINHRDKNGNKIYVGDIIDAHQTNNGINTFLVFFDKQKKV